MKHTLSLIGIIMMSTVCIFCSCSDSPDSISERQILKQCNKALEESAKDQAFCTIETGYYELDSQSGRYELRRLAAAGLITYEVERYGWWKKIVNTYKERAGLNYYTYEWNYITKSYTTYDYNEHFLVKVALTENAKKLQVDSLPHAKEIEDIDMKQPKFEEDKYPECKVKYAESWPRIPRPDEKEEKGISDTITIDDSVEEKTEEEVASVQPAKKQELEERELAYLNEKSKLSSKMVFLKAYSVEFVKARNIVIHDNNGMHTATAEVISEIGDVTDAGRVEYFVINGVRRATEVTFNYYLDKGWELNVKE